MDGEIDYDSYSTTDYSYAAEDSHSIFYWHELIPTAVVYGITFGLGLAGNCLIIFTTFRYRRMQSVTNIFLASLASSDLLLIIVCIPVKLAKLFSYTWDMGLFVCKFVHYMQNVSAICSVLTLTAISIERYYAILHPMKAKYICTISQSRRILLVIWIISFLLGSPTLVAQVLLHTKNIEMNKVHLPVGLNNEYFWCVKNWDWDFIWRFHELYMLFVILIVPFCIMSFSYTLICWEVWKVMEKRSVMTSKHALSRQHNNPATEQMHMENFHLRPDKRLKLKNTRDDTRTVKQVIYMLVAVVILFAICWTPVLVDNVITAYGALPHLRMGPLRYMSTAFNLMAYFNSCINPIIYGFMSKSFRESFVLALCCSSEIGAAHRGSSYSLRYVSRTGSQTRNTSIR